MAEAVFWISVIFIAYVYFGYPLLLAAWKLAAPRRVHKSYGEPPVSIVIAMRNERANAERKIRNCMELDYPAEKMQVIVSLDGPTDGVEAVVRPYASRGVEIVFSPVHRGKAAALNAAMEAATGEIVVFTDARQQLHRDAVRELAANFSDPEVGAVSGELVLLEESGREASSAIGVYWRYEKWLRALESATHSVIGATGAIYAIRRELFTPLPPGTILDDVLIPMRIVLGGKRVVFDSSARAYDLAAANPKAEYARKARTLTGNYQLLAEMPALLAPWRNPVFLQFLSHKAGRLLVPYFLVGLFVSNLPLEQGIYRAAFLLQLFWYALAAIGALAARRRPPGTPAEIECGRNQRQI
ncbi:MAG TPA: glycosyltransferase family 2 protein [Bryobacterales bacterium]|nr:glycosyltransferase family 2 protein [Bryobacterales bacterium]